MTENSKIYIFDGISLTPDEPLERAIDVAAKKIRAAHASPKDFELSIYKKSVDARK